MRRDQLLQVIAEWLREMVFPPSTHREMPSLDLGNSAPSWLLPDPPSGEDLLPFSTHSGPHGIEGDFKGGYSLCGFRGYRLQGFGSPDVDSLFAAFQQLAGRQPRFLILF